MIVLVRKLWYEPFFSLFAAYWATGGIVNLIDFVPGLASPTRQTIGAVYNMLDVPVMLAILYFVTSSLRIKRFSAFAFVVYAILELSGIIIKGINYDALKYPLATGIAFVLIVVTWEIARYLQKVEHSNKQNAKALIYAALWFEYATFILIYIFDYFTPKEFYDLHRNDIFLIYYISTLVGIGIACCGYLLYQKMTKDEPVKNEININII